MKIFDNLKYVDTDVLVTGKKKNSLYVLYVSNAYVQKTSRNTSPSVWHARLGHIGYQLLHKISTKNMLNCVPMFKNFNTDVVCASCQYGKSHRLPFQKSTNRACFMLQLIHSDLLGPIRTPSYSSFQYAMIVVDDFSRYTL